MTGRKTLAADHDVLVLAPEGIAELPLLGSDPHQERVAPLLLSLCLRIEEADVAREPGHDAIDSVFPLAPAFQISIEPAHAQRLQGRGDFLTQHSQGLRCLSSHEHALALGQEVPEQVSDRMGLPRSRWSLDQHRAAPLETSGDLLLRRVRRLGEEEVDREAYLGRGLGFSSVRLVHWRRRRVLDDPHKPERQLDSVLEGLEEGVAGSLQANEGWHRQQQRSPLQDWAYARFRRLAVGRTDLAHVKNRGQLFDHGVGRASSQRMGTSFLTAALDDGTAEFSLLSIQLGERRKQFRVEERRSYALEEAEFVPLLVEAQLDLQQNERGVFWTRSVAFPLPGQERIGPEKPQGLGPSPVSCS